MQAATARAAWDWRARVLFDEVLTLVFAGFVPPEGGTRARIEWSPEGDDHTRKPALRELWNPLIGMAMFFAFAVRGWRLVLLRRP